MTFEEIREMVSSTITENGQRQITGKALNLALLETLTAIEEFLANNKPEGPGIETVYVVDDLETMGLTPEHQAANAAVYAKCKQACEEGKPLPGIQLDMTYFILSQVNATEGAVMTLLVPQAAFCLPDSPVSESLGDSGLILNVDTMGHLKINEDGTVTELA